jgi:tetratricopeptide (TPR) repeat protein
MGFEAFICYKQSSAKDFADHLKKGLEELGLHTFLDSKDLPGIVVGSEEWSKFRDSALIESRLFILIMTPGVELSSEVRKEIAMARKLNGKEFVFFRQRDLPHGIVFDLGSEKINFSRQQQFSFETKEELLRIAHRVLIKKPDPQILRAQTSPVSFASQSQMDLRPILPKFAHTLSREALESSKGEMFADPEFIGRENELRQLQDALDSILKGQGRTVFISGEAGSGKSRLTREFLNYAIKKGVTVMYGWCLSEVAPPYFPFVEAFKSYFSGLTECEAPQAPYDGLNQPNLGMTQVRIGDQGFTEWLTGTRLVGKQETLSPQLWRDQTYAGIAESLHSIDIQVPVIVLLEDIQWADSASLGLLHYIARTIKDSERILLLATFRSEELITDSEGHPHQLAETLRRMGREDLFVEIRLSGLNQNNVSKIAENMVGGGLQSELAEKLAIESQGNPLYIVETLRLLHERKGLYKENNQWRLAVGEISVPSKIKDIILRRVSTLKNNHRRMLDAASVIGEKFDVELLSSVLGLDILEVLETLDTLVRTTSLVSVEENYFRFDHAVCRETIYSELSAPLKRGYHSRIAEKLESKNQSSMLPFSDLAYHHAHAGNSEKAVKYAFSAGQEELKRFSNIEAIEHFAYVLENLPNTTQTVEMRRHALEGLGDAYLASGKYENAIKTFENLANSSTDTDRLRAYRKEMEAVFWKESRPERLLELVKKAETYMVLDQLEGASISQYKARALLLTGDVTGCLREVEKALKVFKEKYILPKIASGLFGISSMHMVLDFWRKGFGEMLQAFSLFQELGDIRGEMTTIDYGLGDNFFSAGLFQEAKNYYSIAFQIAQKIGAFDSMANAWDYLGAISLILEDNVDVALSHSLKALDYAQKTDSESRRIRLICVLVVRYAMLGDLPHAQEYYDELLKTPMEVLKKSYPSEVEWSENFLLSAKGSYEGAEKIIKEMKLPFGWQITFRTCFACLLRKQGKIKKANAQLEEIQKLKYEAQKPFEHVDVQASLMTKKDVVVGEEFELRLALVNVSKTSGTITKVEEMIPTDFTVTRLPVFCSVQDGAIELKEKILMPFQSLAIKISLKATKIGEYRLNPTIKYIDDLEENRSFNPEPAMINVREAIAQV